MTVKVLPPEITLPDTTAVWEQQLEAINEGKLYLEDFEYQQEEIICGFLSHARSMKIVSCYDCPGRTPVRLRG